MDPMGSHEFPPMGRRSFPMWSVPFHMGNRRPIEDISCESGHFPWGWHVYAHHPMWLTWDRLYPIGKVFYFPWDELIIFQCERQLHVKNLHFRVWYFPMGHKKRIYPRGKVTREILFHAMKAKNGWFSLNTRRAGIFTTLEGPMGH